MTQATEPTTVTSSIEVAAPLERAFEVFTRDFGAFKPATHNLLAVPIAETVVETHPGGHIIDRGTDGSECRWAASLPLSRQTGYVQLGHQPVWHRVRPGEIQRGRGDVHRARRGPHPRRDRTPPPRPTRRGWTDVREGVSTGEGWPLYLTGTPTCSPIPQRR